MVPFADSLGIEEGFREQDTQRVSYTANHGFHVRIITVNASE
jgi:hypothetical protein